MGDARAIAAVADCLEDSELEVRRTAVEVLRVLVRKCCHQAIQASCARLSHQLMDVREAAIQVISHVSGEGYSTAMTTLIEILRNAVQDPHCKCAVLSALGAFAYHDDELA